MQLLDINNPFYYKPGRKNPNVPYIGVTGFTREDDVARIIDQYYKHRKSNHLLMAGVLVSKQVLDTGSHSNRSKKYPDIESIPGILDAATDDLVMRTIHYYTKKTDDLFTDVRMMMENLKWKNLVDAFQFNVAFPPPARKLLDVATMYPGIKIIVQVNSGAMERYNIWKIGDIIGDMEGVATHVLIDESEGTGKNINMTTSIECFDRLQENTGITIGFAGGFSMDNVFDRVIELVELTETTWFSIDAQGKLRDEKDDFDCNRASSYVKQFFNAISMYK